MSLIPVTKKNNPSFVGFATAAQIAQNPNLVVAGKNHDAEDRISKAAAKAAEKAALDAAVEAGKPSEAKPSDVRRRPEPKGD